MTNGTTPYPPPPGQYAPPGYFVPTGQYGPPPPPVPRSKRTLWIGLGAAFMTLVLCVGGGFAVRAYNMQRSAERAVAYDAEHNPVKRELVDALVAAQTQALQAGDQKAYLAAFDPADKKLIATQTRVFQNLTKIPFSEATYAHRAMRDVTPRGAGFTFDLLVGFLHRIGDYDQALVERSYFWKIVQEQKDGPLKITAVDRIPDGFGASDRDFYPTPWDKWKTVHVQKTAHTLLIVDGSLRAQARRHAPALEAAAVRNINAWKASGVAGDIPPGFVVPLVKGTKELGTLWRVAKEPPTEAGLSMAIPSTRDDANGNDITGPQVAGSRVVIDLNSSFFDARNTGGPANIFRHELAHSMMAAMTVRDETPFADNELSTWLVEGFAEYMAYAPRSWTTSNRIPGAKERFRLDQGKAFLPSNSLWDQEALLSYHYLLGHSAVGYIAAKYGEEKMFLLVAEHYRGKKDQIPALLGVSQEQFAQQWAAYVAKRLR